MHLIITAQTWQVVVLEIMASVLALFVTITLWYTTSTGYNLITKKLVRNIQLDVLTLSLVHASVGITFLLFSKKPKTRSSILINPSDESSPERHLMQSSSPASLSHESACLATTIDNKGLPSFTKNLTDVIVLGIFQTIGNVFTLYSLSLLSVPLVLTIKATEPMFAMLLVKCLRLQDSNLNVFKCIAMLLMVTGTIMASMKEVEFEMAAFVASVMANLGFQMRNIYTKYMSKTFLSNGYNYGILSASTFLWVFLLICGKLLLTFISFSSFTNEHHMVLQLEKDMTLLDLNGLVLVSGICYSSYNFFSLGVLSFVSPVTHSVLNSLKKLLIIWVSIVLFNSPVTAVGLLGTFLVIAGSLGYAYAIHTTNQDISSA